MNQSDLREILSQNIKTKRKIYSLTQEKLAEETGLSAQTINDIEGCRTWVSDKTLIKLSEVLHTTPAELLINTTIENKEMDILQLKSKMQESIHHTIDDIFNAFIERNNI